MSILSSVTNILDPKIPGIGVPHEDCKPAKHDDCDKQSKSNDDHKGREESKNDDHKDRDDFSKHAKNDERSDDGRKDDHSKDGKDDHSKHAKNDDRSDDGRKDDHSKDGKDDHSKHAKNDNCSDDGRKDDHSKDGKDDHSKHAKNDDCQPHKDDCQPQKDHCDAKPSDDCGKGDTYHNPGEALAKLDFSHGDFGSHGPDHSGDMQGALASMSSDHALDYAIAQMGPADHFDAGNIDVPADTSHDTVHHA